MPTYQYYCSACEKSYDIFHSIKDPVKTDCPECKQATLQKQITSAGVVFKGTGFYQTDYNNNSNAPSCGKGACQSC